MALRGRALPTEPEGGGFVLPAIWALPEALEALARLAEAGLIRPLSAVPGRPQVSDIIRRVSAATGVSPAEIVGRRRQVTLVRPRHMACWLAQHATTLTLTQIAHQFGRRDHTTIMHACNRFAELRGRHPMWRDASDKLLRELTGDGQLRLVFDRSAQPDLDQSIST